MYYSLDYVQRETEAFNKEGGSAFYTDEVKTFLELEGKFVSAVSEDFFQSQANRFPYGIIRDFLQVYPKLDTTLKTRYRIEKEFLLRAMDNEGYLVGAKDAEIDLFYDYYQDGYDVGGKVALQDVKTAMKKGSKESQRLGSQMGISFTLKDPMVRNKLKWEAGKRITRINETTRRLIVSSLIGAYDNGAGYEGMKKDLKKLFQSWKVPKSGQWFTNKRAEMISRTELGQAVSWAREESYARRDVKKKSWLAEPKACEVCTRAVGDGIIAFDQQFSNGFLGPLAHPNCRCALLPEVEIQDYLKGYAWHGEEGNASHSQV